jgi:hypothetical protein
LGSGVIGEVLGATLAVIAGLSYLRGRLARDTTGLLREPWAGWSRLRRATVTLAVAMGFALLEVLLFQAFIGGMSLGAVIATVSASGVVGSLLAALPMDPS